MHDLDWIIFAALAQEYAIARRLLTRVREEVRPRRHAFGLLGKSRVMLVRTGMGPHAAEKGAQWALANGRPRRALMYGFAGGLTPAHGVGTLVRPTTLKSSSGEELAVEDWGFPAPANVRGTLITVREVVATPPEKASLAERHHAIAVDMESFNVAKVCKQASVPIAIARAISDGVNTSIPVVFDNIHHPDGRVLVLNAIWTLARHPHLIPRAFELQRGSAAASRSLRSLLLHLRDHSERLPSS